MSVKKEVERQVFAHWQDERVAEWVLDRMPLLEKGSTHSLCPVLSLSMEKGLRVKVGDESLLNNFRKAPKIITSGGFEGNRGHIRVVSDMQEVRMLTNPERLVVLMLEPDSYIAKHKAREPIVNMEQRSDLWSTSGLVDAVILLPEEDGDMKTEKRYVQIHRHIQPAVWCANIENPDWQQIIMRGELDFISLVRILVHKNEVHTSFLRSTMNMSAGELKEALLKYSLEIAKKASSHQSSMIISPEQIAGIIYDKFVQGL
jgi:glycerol-3-phosphate cytidylyltransferase-like family protein